MKVCPALHGPDDLDPGFFVCPVPVPLERHHPPRPAYDVHNAYARRNSQGKLTWNPNYSWGDALYGHAGDDLGIRYGDPIVAAQNGVAWWVDLVNRYPADPDDLAGVHTAVILPCPECGGWFLYRDLHMIEGSVSIRLGDRVYRGQISGRGGLSGNANWPHDHFEIRHSTDPDADKNRVYPSRWGIAYEPQAWGILLESAGGGAGKEPNDMYDHLTLDVLQVTLDNGVWEGDRTPETRGGLTYAVGVWYWFAELHKARLGLDHAPVDTLNREVSAALRLATGA